VGVHQAVGRGPSFSFTSKNRSSPIDTYYENDLAWVHHTGYSQHVERCSPGIVRLLRDAVPAGARVLDVGCGSGLLARRLLAEGYAVTGIDASPAMIELAREHAPGGTFEVVRLPTRAQPGTPRGLPESAAVVSTGHVLNYLDGREIRQTLAELAQALRPGGLLAIDLMTDGYAQRAGAQAVHAKVADDWVIVTLFSRPQPERLDRDITVFRRAGETWRRSDEHHRNVAFDVSEALQILRANGVDAQQRPAFGEEALPEGLVVLTGVRRDLS
jgi:2-polyprenyl-3-methyl-5-hydroxy-6-metoxy-1,4-benzoquinol methylase